MARQRYEITQWNGGISNDEFVGQKGGFYDGENVQIRRNSKYFYLSNNAGTEVAVTGKPTAFLGSSSSDIMVFTSSGKIYQAGSLVFTNTGASTNYRNATTFTTTSGGTYDSLIFTPNKIHRFNFATPGTVVEDYWTLSNSSNYKPLLLFNGILYIGNGNKIAIIEKTTATGTLTDTLELETGDSVRAITTIGDQIIIWCANGSNGVQYFWDGQSDTTSRKIIWYDLPIINVANLGNYHIVRCSKNNPGSVVLSNQRFVFMSDGYTKSLLYKCAEANSSTSYTEKLAIGSEDSDQTNAIETYGTVTYLPATNALYSYGEYFPGLPKSMVKEFTFTGYPTAMYTTNFGLYFGYFKTGGQGYYSFRDFRESNNVYAATGYIETNPIVGRLQSTRKAALKVKLGYILPHSSTSIKIYHKINDASSYTLWNTITDTTANDFMDLLNANFYKIQFKIELLTSNAAYTPKIYDFLFVYDEVKNDI